MADNNFERPDIHKNVKHFGESAYHTGETSSQIFGAVGTGANIVQSYNTQMFPMSTYPREQGPVSSSREKFQAGPRSTPLQERLSARPPDDDKVMKTSTGKSGSRHDQSGVFEIHSKGTCIEAENRTIHQSERNKNENEVKEEKVPLTKVLYKLIQVSKEKQLPDVKVIFGHSREDTVCTLKGSPDDIEQFKRVVDTMGKRLIEMEVMFSTEITYMLNEINLEDSINTQLEERYPGFIAEQRRNVIYLFGFDRNMIDRVKQYVCLLITKSDHLLIGDLRNKSPLIQDHFNHAFRNRIVARVSNCRLHMVGLKEAIDEANGEFVEIVEGRKSLCTIDTFDNKEITQTFRIEEDLKCQFLAKSSLLQDVMDTSKVKIYPRLVDCTFDVQGSEESVTLAMKRLSEIVTHLITDYMDISYAESVNYFTSALKDWQIQSLMTQFKVHIHRNVLFSCGTIQVKKEPRPDTNSCIWTSPDGKLLVLECFTLDNVKADLLYLPVKADVSKGTSDVGRFIGKSVKDRQRLVEIAFPDLNPNDTSLLSTVEKIVNEAIVKAGRGKTKSVAFLVSPFGKWDDENLMQCIVNSSVKWFLNSQNEFPSSVLLCTRKEDCFFWTDDYIDRCLLISIQDACGFMEQPDICVIQGYIDKAEVDVIVNTTDSNLDLRHGNVSAALLRAAGDQLQRECSEKFPRGIKPNDIVMTDGYKLKCKKVFHVSLQAQARSTDEFIHEKIIRQTVLLCLKKASDNGYRSMAFPALGAGTLKYPTKSVASEMLMSVERFVKDCPSTKLREITFVIHPKDVNVFETFSRLKEKVVPKKLDVNVKLEIVGMENNVKSCMEYLRSRQTNTGTDVNVHAGVPVACIVNAESGDLQKVGKRSRSTDKQNNMDKKKETTKENTARDKPIFLKSFIPDREQSDLSEVNAEYILEKSQMLCTFAKDDEHQVKVIIKEDDIVNMTGVTAVVCSEGRDGKGKGIVARLLLEKGGKDYQHVKAQQFTCHRTYGEVITTTGGNNNYTWIMHAIISRRDPKFFALLYRNIFEEIQRREFESVALPLIGTGVGSVDPRSSTEMLVHELIQFCKTQAKGMLTLHVVINDDITVKMVKDVFKRMISKGQEKKQEQLDDTSSPHIEQNALRMDDKFAKSLETMYSRHTGGAWPKFEEKPPYTGVLFSDREPDRVSARDSSACSSLAEPQNGVTLSYQIRHTRNLEFMTKTSLLRTIDKEFKVCTFVDKDQCCFDIKGSREDVKLALKRIEDIDKSISVNSIEICNERAVIYFKKKSGDEYLASVDRSCDVLLVKETIYSTDGTTVKKVVSDKNVVWTCLGRKLTLEKNKVDDVKASLKVTPVVKNKDGSVFSKNGNIVEMEIGWKAPDLERLVTELLKTTSEDNEREVALPLNPVGNCTFDEVMKGFVNCFIQWLFLQQAKPFPSSVLLFTETVHYYDRADTYIEDRILDIFKGKKRHGQTKIHLVKDQLDQTQADVLVNTTAPQLDLTSGEVSAAHLKAAGPGLQQECRPKYPTGIKQNSVAVTTGHGLKCKQVFHVTLPLYKEGMESVKNVRDAMMLRLQKASKSRHISIAFPAIGTGKLRYPLDIVSSEMYDAVERFIQECPDTSLRSIIFVIFPKDVDLFKQFEIQQKRYTNEAETNGMQSSVSIHIIGMPEKVSLAKEMIQSKQKELMINVNVNDTVTEVIPSVSSTDFSALVKFYRKEFDSFAETGVRISHNKNKKEIEMCGTRAKIGVAIDSVKSYLNNLLDMPKCELSMNCSNDKLIYNLNRNEDVCIVRDDHAPSLFVFAKSENILDQIKSSLQWQNESSTTTLATMMENSNLSERDKEEMDISDNGLICSQTESAVKKTALTREFSWSKDAEHVDIYETGNLVIKIYKANILHIPVDAIVNAPSQGEGGSALAAGEAVLRFCETPVCHKRDVHRGGKCEIDAGWPCWWADSRHSEEGLYQYFNALKQTVYNCFLTADNSQIASIGLQTKGSVPTDVCATQCVTALLEFSDKSTTLREIHIVDDDRSNVDIVHKTFSAMIREGKQSPFPLSVYLQQPSSEDSHKAVKTNIKHGNKIIKWTGRSKPKMSSVSSNPSPGMTVAAYRSDKNRLVCTFQQSHEVYIYDGDITQVQNIDAMVCSESNKGEATGKISKTLLERGGQRYAESKAAQFETKKSIGEVVTTEGGCNNYKWVIHAMASRKNERLLPEIYKNIFQEANMRELHSVALPLLEAGDLGPEDSAKILFTEFNRFFNERKGKGLTLHVVLNDPTISYVVKEVFKGCIDEMTGGPSQEEETMLQKNDDNVQQNNVWLSR